MLVAYSSHSLHTRRIIVAYSSHTLRILVAYSSRTRRVLVAWRVCDEYTTNTPRACENGKLIICASASTLNASSLNTQWPVARSRRSVYEANAIAWEGFVHMLPANTRTKSYIGQILATTTNICNKCNVALVYTICLTIGISTLLHIVHYTTTQLNCIGRSCSQHQFRGQSIRQVSCYTLLGGFQLL